jgi:hypothetical protein
LFWWFNTSLVFSNEIQKINFNDFLSSILWQTLSERKAAWITLNNAVKSYACWWIWLNDEESNWTRNIEWLNFDTETWWIISWQYLTNTKYAWFWISSFLNWYILWWFSAWVKYLNCDKLNFSTELISPLVSTLSTDSWKWDWTSLNVSNVWIIVWWKKWNWDLTKTISYLVFATDTINEYSTTLTVEQWRNSWASDINYW